MGYSGVSMSKVLARARKAWRLKDLQKIEDQFIEVFGHNRRAVREFKEAIQRIRVQLVEWKDGYKWTD